VRHKQIFSASARLEARQLLLSLRTRNTDMLLGAVAKFSAIEGIELISSPPIGAATRQAWRNDKTAPDAEELKDIATAAP